MMKGILCKWRSVVPRPKSYGSAFQQAVYHHTFEVQQIVTSAEHAALFFSVYHDGIILQTRIA